MARTSSQRLEFWQFDVGLFDDPKIVDLNEKYGLLGEGVYFRILSLIASTDGYYATLSDGLILSIYRSIGSRWIKNRQLISGIIHYCGVCGLFDVNLLQQNVITSCGIQRRWLYAKKKSRSKGFTTDKFWLLEKQELCEVDEKTDNCSNNTDNCNNNTDNCSNNSSCTSEVKENEDISSTNNKDTSNNSTYIGTDERNEILNGFREVGERRQEARRAFFAKYTNLKDDPSVDDSHIDYRKLAERFARSKKHLQDAHSLAWVVRNYTSILEDKYVDYAEKPSGNSAASSASSAPSTPKEKPLPADVLAANAKSERERFYARRREKAQNAAEQLTERIKQKEPRFKEITTELSKMEFALAKAEVFEPSKLPALKKEKGALLSERWELLARLGIKEEQLLPEFYHVCKRCQDTGFLPSGAACKCYKKEN